MDQLGLSEELGKKLLLQNELDQVNFGTNCKL
jgi:hypothetical protein